MSFRNCNWNRPQISRSALSDEPRIIDGAEAINTLCPVSSATGLRSSVISLLGMVTNQNQRLIDSILTELPAVREMDAPDDVKIQQLIPAEFGTFAERDAQIQRLSTIADVLFEKPVKQDSAIQFSPADNPSSQTAE